MWICKRFPQDLFQAVSLPMEDRFSRYAKGLSFSAAPLFISYASGRTEECKCPATASTVAMAFTFGANPTKDASGFNGLPYLSAGTTRGSTGTPYRYAIDVDDLPPFTRPQIAERSNRRPLTLPALILHRGLRDHRPCAALAEPRRWSRPDCVCIVYYGISLARAPEDLGVPTKCHPQL